MNEVLFYLGIASLFVAFSITLAISLCIDHVQEKRYRHTSRW